jgi:hypothetical protein
MEQSLTQALQNAIVKVFWTREDMRRMLLSSGVPQSLLGEQDWSQHKFVVLTPIVDRLNRAANGKDILQSIMREVLAYPHCDHLLRWPDGLKRKLDAEVALEHLRTMSAFIEQGQRNAQSERQVREQRRATQLMKSELNKRLLALKTEFIDYMGDANRQAAGIGLERILHELFEVAELAPRGPFSRTGEQIDGAFALGQDRFLLEAKWQQEPVNLSQLRDLSGAVSSTLDNTLGLFVSINGFSQVGLDAYTQGNRPCLFCADGQDLMIVLEGRIPLADLLRRKKDLASERRTIFVSGNDILMGRG